MKPKGVAVYIRAIHQCMTTREWKNLTFLQSLILLGEFKTDLDYKKIPQLYFRLMVLKFKKKSVKEVEGVKFYNQNSMKKT